MANSGGRATVTVRIGGEEHIIRSNVEPDYTLRCAEWVDRRIMEIRSQVGLIESHKVAILAALSITDELFQARAQLRELRDGTAGRARALALRLEEAAEPLVEDEVAAGEAPGAGPEAPEASAQGGAEASAQDEGGAGEGDSPEPAEETSQEPNLGQSPGPGGFGQLELPEGG
jgi:cell division protein ZapA